MSLKIRSSYAILTASVLGLMTGCGEGASEGMEPEVTSDVQPLPPLSVEPLGPPGEEMLVQAASGISGHFDGVWGGVAYGWSCLPSIPWAQTYTWIRRWNGKEWIFVAQGWNTLYRGDIASSCGGNGSHAFAMPVSNGSRGLFHFETVSNVPLADGSFPRIKLWKVTGG